MLPEHHWRRDYRKSPSIPRTTSQAHDLPEPRPIASKQRHTANLSLQVNCAGVAEARGQANPRSISNRLSTIKKKYAFPFVAGNTNGDKPKAKAAGDDSDNEGGSSPVKKATPKRPATGTKRKATATSRKAAKKVKAEEVPLPEGDADAEASDEAEDGSQEKGSQMTSVFTAVNAPQAAAPAEETSEEALYEKYDEST